MPLAVVGLDKGLRRLPAEDMLLDELVHKPLVLGGQAPVPQVPEQDVLFLAVLRSVLVPASCLPGLVYL